MNLILTIFSYNNSNCNNLIKTKSIILDCSNYSIDNYNAGNCCNGYISNNFNLSLPYNNRCYFSNKFENLNLLNQSYNYNKSEFYRLICRYNKYNKINYNNHSYTSFIITISIIYIFLCILPILLKLYEKIKQKYYNYRIRNYKKIYTTIYNPCYIGDYENSIYTLNNNSNDIDNINY